MNQIYPDASLVPLLQRILSGDLRIYITGAAGQPFGTGTTLASLDISEDFAANVAASAFVATGVTAHRGYALAAPIAITNNVAGGGWTAYGYAVTNAAGTVLLWGATFDATVVVPYLGTVTVTPLLGGFSNFTS